MTVLAGGLILRPYRARHSVVIALALLLSACGEKATDPSGATLSEARQLNEAAAMLDEDSVSANALADNDADEEQ